MMLKFTVGPACGSPFSEEHVWTGVVLLAPGRLQKGFSEPSLDLLNVGSEVRRVGSPIPPGWSFTSELSRLMKCEPPCALHTQLLRKLVVKSRLLGLLWGSITTATAD